MLACALATLVLGACEEPPPIVGQSTPTTPEGPRIDDPSIEPPSSTWPAEVGGLDEELARFSTVDDCRARLRARTPTLVSEGIAELRYDAFFDDVCRSLAAVSEGSVEGCDALSTSALREGCRRRLALSLGRPELCPDGRLVEGRDPVCVAWAARAPELCAAASLADAPRCRAVLAGDAEGCARLRGGDRGRCEAEVARYAGALGDERAATRLPAPRMELELRAAGAEPERIERDALSRGVRLAPEGCRWRVALQRPQGERELRLGLGRPEASFHLELVVPTGALVPAVIPLGPGGATLTVTSRERGRLSSVSGAQGEVTLSRFEPTLGGAVEGTLEGTLRAGGEAIRLRGRFASFVRDLDPPDPACPAPP